ncbi:hypothetical protein ADUPG1_011039, partial [Aduncisulcus paluster]
MFKETKVAYIIGETFRDHLTPIIGDTPELLVKVANIPVIEFMLAHLHNHGFGQVCIFIKADPKKRVLKYLENSPRWSKSDFVQFNVISRKFENTLSIISHINMNLNPPSTFLLIDGPVITNIDYTKLMAFHKASQSRDIPFDVTTVMCEDKGGLYPNADPRFLAAYDVDSSELVHMSKLSVAPKPIISMHSQSVDAGVSYRLNPEHTKEVDDEEKTSSSAVGGSIGTGDGKGLDLVESDALTHLPIPLISSNSIVMSSKLQLSHVYVVTAKPVIQLIMEQGLDVDTMFELLLISSGQESMPVTPCVALLEGVKFAASIDCPAALASVWRSLVSGYICGYDPLANLLCERCESYVLTAKPVIQLIMEQGLDVDTMFELLLISSGQESMPVTPCVALLEGVKFAASIDCPAALASVWRSLVSGYICGYDPLANLLCERCESVCESTREGDEVPDRVCSTAIPSLPPGTSVPATSSSAFLSPLSSILVKHVVAGARKVGEIAEERKMQEINREERHNASTMVPVQRGNLCAIPPVQLQEVAKVLRASSDGQKSSSNPSTRSGTSSLSGRGEGSSYAHTPISSSSSSSVSSSSSSSVYSSPRLPHIPLSASLFPTQESLSTHPSSTSLVSSSHVYPPSFPGMNSIAQPGALSSSRLFSLRRSIFCTSSTNGTTTTKMCGRCVLGHNVDIESGVVLRSVCVGPESRIGRQCVLSEVLIGERCVIGACVHMQECILGDGVVVKPEVKIGPCVLVMAGSIVTRSTVIRTSVCGVQIVGDIERGDEPLSSLKYCMIAPPFSSQEGGNVLIHTESDKVRNKKNSRIDRDRRDIPDNGRGDDEDDEEEEEDDDSLACTPNPMAKYSHKATLQEAAHQLASGKRKRGEGSSGWIEHSNEDEYHAEDEEEEEDEEDDAIINTMREGSVDSIPSFTGSGMASPLRRAGVDEYETSDDQYDDDYAEEEEESSSTAWRSYIPTPIAIALPFNVLPWYAMFAISERVYPKGSKRQLTSSVSSSQSGSSVGKKEESGMGSNPRSARTYSGNSQLSCTSSLHSSYSLPPLPPSASLKLPISI